MLAGFNHNVKHKGKLYHVQTEDSGVANPHVITHLFVGGNILASKRTSYADLVGAGDLAAVVRSIMEQQHKEMLRNLVNGVYDEVDSARSAQARAYQPGQIAPSEPFDPAPLRSGRTEQPAAPSARDAAAARSGPREEKPRPALAVPPRPAPPAPAQPARAAPPAPIPAPFGSAAARPAAAAKAAPPQPRPAAPPLRPALTPPPLLHRTQPPLAPPPRAAPAPATSAPPPLRAAPPHPLTSADVLEERSLDEVILSYLAEDLGGRK
jgi:hypothetical protein